ncbi:MAG: AzlC family ABC transporter permease [Telmatospirillum sp.]|nr:AzlC family ABC transporter permease [Telmatospirillum sp.]
MKRGFLRAQPLTLGGFVYGAAFGLLAREAGLSLAEATGMSVFIFSGTAQVATVSALAAGAQNAALAIAVAVLLLNARYVLYGAALRPWLGGLPAYQTYPTLFFVVDGIWVLSLQAHAVGERDGGFVLGAGVANILPWVLGTGVGLEVGNLIANPAVLGLDFMLVAFSAGMGLRMFKLRPSWSVVAAAAATAMAVDRFAPGGWTIVAAGLVGGLVAYLRFKPAATP